MRFVATLFLALSLALPLNARALSEEEQAGLTKAVDSYRRVTTAKNAEKIVATIPPRVLNVFAGTAGIEASKVEDTLVAQTAELLKTTAITDFVTAPGPFDGNDATLQDGTKVVWAVVPTQFTAEGKAGKSRNSQPLLAILESGKWYFSRIDGPQQQQIVSFAYPFIAGVSLPAATSTPLQ
jgi:hypothetical protein